MESSPAQDSVEAASLLDEMVDPSQIAVESIFSPAPENLKSLPKRVRVELKRTDLELEFHTEGRLDLILRQGGDTSLMANIRGEFTVKRNGNDLEILHPGKKFWKSIQGDLLLISQNPENFIQADGLKYRDQIEVVPTLDGKLSLIGNLQLENYLKGVLPYEMPATDKATLEALKAQAVAARTYALSHLGQFKEQPFDLYADTRDQVYQGVKAETFLSNKAVEETAGIVMVYNGKLAKCYYHSTCGGKTSNLHEVWTTQDPIDYLQSVEDYDSANGRNFCHRSKYTRWFEKWKRGDLAKIIRANQEEARALKNLPFSRLDSLVIRQKTKSGRVKTLDIHTDKGALTIHGDKIRWALKRNMYGNPILLSSWFDITEQSQEIRLEGRGFGHGIGLCQMGAMERARQGTPFHEILFHYYLGADLVELP